MFTNQTKTRKKKETDRKERGRQKGKETERKEKDVKRGETNKANILSLIIRHS